MRNTDMANSLPGLAGPWPDRRKWPVTRRLLAAWRWEYERGPRDIATRNAYNSVTAHAPLGADVLGLDEAFARECAELLQLEDFIP